jgi:DNA-binding transcriptional LysR family regulator
MSDDFDLLAPELTTVLLVAETGSFSRTARHLRLEQSTVSRRVRALEDFLGISLFERRSHGVAPTHAGGAFIEQVTRCRQGLEIALLGAREAGTGRTGVLRIGHVWSFSHGVAFEILSEFRNAHPELRPLLFETGDGELTRRVLQGELDCAFAVARPEWDAVLQVVPLWSERLYLVRSSAAAAPPNPKWQDLEGQTILCRQSADLENIRRQLNSMEGVDARLEIHDCSLESLAALAGSGGGVLILPESLAFACGPELEAAPIDEPNARHRICAIYRRETDNPVLRRFLATSKDWLHQHRKSG